MSDAFYADVWKKSGIRDRMWYQKNIISVLQAAPRARQTDASFALAEELLRVYNEPVAKATPVPLHKHVQMEADSLMKPIEPEVMNILYGSTEKGAAKKYLKMRYKKAPEDKFYFRLTSNWDYGWQQKLSHMKARNNCGRCAILRDTFYRKNNLAADPRHYSSPAGGQVSICSEYSCIPN